MNTRDRVSKTRQFASLLAVGAGAVAGTSSQAEAATMVSPTLNTYIGFTSNSNPSGLHTAASHVFNTFIASGLQLTFRARSFGRNNSSFARFVRAYGAGFQLESNGVGRFSFGQQMTLSAEIGNGFNVGDRTWGSFSSGTNGLPGFTDKYLLFRFTNGGTVDYGWVEASMTVNQSDLSAALEGPNLTIIQYAFDNTGATIAAGDTGAPVAPEPATEGEASLAALILGAAGLRRWRKTRQTSARAA